MHTLRDKHLDAMTDQIEFDLDGPLLDFTGSLYPKWLSRWARWSKQTTASSE